MITNVICSKISLAGLNIRACFATDLWVCATLKKLTKYEEHSYFYMGRYISNKFLAMNVVPYWNIMNALINGNNRQSQEKRTVLGRMLLLLLI